MTSTEVATTAGPTKVVSVLPYEYMGMNERWQYAKALSMATDILPRGMRNGPSDVVAARVFLVFETGAMLGLHPLAALSGIDIIEGSPTITPRLFTALVRQRGFRLTEKISGAIREGTYTHEYTISRPQEEGDVPVTRSFSLEDAEDARLITLEKQPDGTVRVRARSKDGQVLPWEAYTKDMVQWRALSRLMRAGAADVSMGIGYFPEELAVTVNEAGEVVRDVDGAEDELLAELARVTTKAGMATLWEREHPAPSKAPTDAWTQKVEAAFHAHLMTIPQEKAEAPTSPTAEPDQPTGEVPDAEEQFWADQEAAAQPPRRQEMTVEQADQAERAETHERRQAAGGPVRAADGMIPPGAAIAAARGENAAPQGNTGAPDLSALG